jgi:hypothetical protein
MEYWVKFILSAVLAGILFGIVVNLCKPKTNPNDITIKYELQIDSIKHEICKRNHIVDSLNLVIAKNDSTIKDLTVYIGTLNNDRIVIKKKYESRDKELKEMSNDSIVMFVREQLGLWAE